ncbi:hypothetical protein PG996_014267 [Apiospora saccharicola]|uniref:Rhomboid family membrane protein n=1 Tax=Apiospora saccharicola TaxID=335842 RepID=A0ABR1TKM2_9PEZI
MATPNDAASQPGRGTPLDTPPQPAQSQYKDPLLHNVALGMTPIAVGAMFLPPRRLDFRMLVLGGSALWGMNQLSYDYRGQSLAQKYGFTRVEASSDPVVRAQQQREANEAANKLKYGGMSDMPTERSAMMQRRIREEKARRLELAGLSEAERVERLQELQRRGALESIWMGDADEDWKAERDRKEKEALQDGGVGYWGLITEQLSEVWTRGEKKAQEKEAELKKQLANTKDKVESEVKKSS